MSGTAFVPYPFKTFLQMSKNPIGLLVNDLHVDKDCIAEFAKNWSEVIKICVDRNIRDIFIGGDVFTSRSSQTLSVLLEVQRAFHKACAKDIGVTVAEGNHDKVDQEAIEGYCHLYDSLGGNVLPIDTCDVFTWEDNDVELAMISYFKETGSLYEKIQKVESKIKNFDKAILYLHAGIHGALGDFDIPGEAPQEWFSKFSKVLVGHYHNRTKIKGTNIEYIGSSRQNNFGEDEEKGYTILYSDGSTEFVKNQVNTRYRTLEYTYEELMEAMPLQLDNVELYKTRCKVRLTEAQSKKFDEKPLIECGVTKVEKIIDSIESVKASAHCIDEKYDKNGIKKEYVNFCDIKKVDSSLGVEYLNKI